MGREATPNLAKVCVFAHNTSNLFCSESHLCGWKTTYANFLISSFSKVPGSFISSPIWINCVLFHICPCGSEHSRLGRSLLKERKGGGKERRKQPDQILLQGQLMSWWVVALSRSQAPDRESGTILFCTHSRTLANVHLTWPRFNVLAVTLRSSVAMCAFVWHTHSPSFSLRGKKKKSDTCHRRVVK